MSNFQDCCFGSISFDKKPTILIRCCAETIFCNVNFSKRNWLSVFVSNLSYKEAVGEDIPQIEEE